MFIGFQHLHNFLRWILLIVAVITIVKYLMGWLTQKEFKPSDGLWGTVLTALIDSQLLIGLVLFFMGSAHNNLINETALTMKTASMRFFALEHGVGMVIALVLVHIGKSKVKREADSTAKFKKGFIYYAISLIIMLAMIPWPWRAEIGRALFPGMSVEVHQK